MIKRSLIDKVLNRVALVDPDYNMENLVPPMNSMEDLEDAASGSVEALPKKTLRNRRDQYPLQPLRVRPDYGEDGRPMILTGPNQMQADDQSNLKDFSCPEEMLKHQENPYPRTLLDEFIERNRPGPFVDQILKDYDNRAWDPNEAPEVSEDLIDRLRYTPSKRPDKTFRLPIQARVINAYLDSLAGIIEESEQTGPDPMVVLSRHFLNVSPLVLDLQQTREAMTLNDLARTKIKNNPLVGRGDERDPETVSVAPFPEKSNPKLGLWAYRTNGKYITYFQFIPEGKGGSQTVNKMKVRVSCNCRSWVWWGAQYNAYAKDYLYGPVMPMLLAPKIRDPKGEFLCCKHVLGCIKYVRTNKIKVPISPEVGKVPPTEIELPKVPEAELRVPGYLANVKNKPQIRSILKKWESMSKEDQDEFMKGLDNFPNIMYMGYRFPYSAAPAALDQLKLRLKEIGPREYELRNRVNQAISDFSSFIKRVQHFMNLHSLRQKRAAAEAWSESAVRSTWKGLSKEKKQDYINKINDPAEVYSIFLMFPKDSLDLVLPRLREMTKDSKTRVKAQEYLRRLI